MRQGVRQVFGNVQEQVAALRDVQQLHADANAKHGQSAIGDQAHQQSDRISRGAGP